MTAGRVLHALLGVCAALQRVGGGDKVSLHRLLVTALAVAAVAGVAPAACGREPVRAVASAASEVVVENVDVEQVAALAPGVPLVFTVFGTPGASAATLRIDGGRRALALHETDPGVYEGTYVIDAGDAIRPDSRVVATLQRHGDLASSTLDEPLLLARGPVPWDLAGATPGAPSAPLAGAPSERAPVENAAPVPMPIPPVVTAAPAPRELRGGCADCAVVESVRAIEAPPRGGAIGAIAGAIAGAVLGHEAGEAHTRRVLTVLGAIGGALGGREIERQATRQVQYEVVLRRPDGTAINRRYEQAPPFAAGDTIRIGSAATRASTVPSF